MKKIYVRPVSEIYDTETVEVICGASKVDPQGLVGGNASKFGTEDPNKNNGDPNFNGYIDDPNEDIVVTAKEFDLWGDW